MTKTCFKCGENQPLDQFYKHNMMADGHLNKCKKCTRADVAANINKKKLDKNWVRLERERCRKKQERYRMLGVAHKVTKEIRDRWVKKNPHKVIAHIHATKAVAKGIIEVKTSCEMCGASGVKMNKHHPDYSKPLYVIWLCTKCHGFVHRKDK